MSAAASMPRAPRARVLLVGPAEAIDGLASRLVAPPLRSENLFDAMGRINAAGAGELIGCLVISDQLLRPASAGSIADSFRQLDPSLRIVLCRNGHVQDADCGAFDAAIGESSTAQQLQDALQVPVREPQIPEMQAISASRIEAPPAITDQPEAPLEKLGDVDLVETILAGQPLLDRSLQLIRGQTGWRSLRVSSEPGGARVAYASQEFGFLHCEEAAPAELESWAAWLARWLALEASHGEFRTMAFKDELTGAGNRRACDRFLAQAIELAYQRRRPVTVMVFDIDNFKHFNDNYGHEAGDEILRETIKLLNSVIRKGDHVFRIGGDEFAVVFADPGGPRERGSQPPDSIDQIAGRFQSQVCRMKFPKLGPDAPGTVSISAGLAAYPWDGHDPRTLLSRADELAMQSKRGGKNAITFGPAAAEICRRLDDDESAGHAP